MFPDQAGSNGWPGTDFANACGGTYTTTGGQTTKFLASCPQVATDIQYCQSQGKKILLSLGGGSATGAYVASVDSAIAFADQLWDAFGPVKCDYTGPRPFGDVVIDGFDFDIESLAADIPSGAGIDANYYAMVDEFRSLFAMTPSSQFYISAAPQCVIPDSHLADAIGQSSFDFM